MNCIVFLSFFKSVNITLVQGKHSYCVTDCNYIERAFIEL